MRSERCKERKINISRDREEMCREMWECRCETNVAVSVRGITKTRNGFMNETRKGRKLGEKDEKTRMSIRNGWGGILCVWESEKYEGEGKKRL